MRKPIVRHFDSTNFTNRLPIRTNRLPIRTNRLLIRTNHIHIRTNRLPIRTNRLLIRTKCLHMQTNRPLMKTNRLLIHQIHSRWQQSPSPTTQNHPPTHPRSAGVPPAQAVRIRKSVFAKSSPGSTGDPPVPSGDPPDGTGETLRANGDGRFVKLRSAIPVGESPTGAGGSPALPVLRHALSRNDAVRATGARPSGRRNVRPQPPRQNDRTRPAAHPLINQKKPSGNSLAPYQTHASAACRPRSDCIVTAKKERV